MHRSRHSERPALSASTSASTLASAPAPAPAPARWLASLAIALVTSLPLAATAADTFSVPYTVVPNSARYLSIDPPPAEVPVTIPFTETETSPDPFCVIGDSALSAEMVNGALEIELDGTVTGFTTSPPCIMTPGMIVEVEVAVPDLAGTATAIYLQPEVVTFSFSEIELVTANVGIAGTSSATLGSDFTYPVSFNVNQRWDETGPQFQLGVAPQLFLPGDTVVLRITARIGYEANVLTNGTSGTVRIRLPLKVTVPSPTSSLSLPIGTLALLSLASLRG